MVSFMLHSVCSRRSCHPLLREQGLRPEEIGIVLAVSTAIRVSPGPAVGHVADRLRSEHTTTLCACSLLAAVAGLGYVMIQGFAGFLRGGAGPGVDVSSDSASLSMRLRQPLHAGAKQARADGSSMGGYARQAPLRS